MPTPLVLLPLLALAASGVAWAAECPNCEFAFPKAWSRVEQSWGLEVDAEGDRVAVKVQPDAVEASLGPGDVADELVWLDAEATTEGLTISSRNGRIVRTVSREPAVLLDYAWSDTTGAQGRGFRLVRRCGVRLIFEQRSPEPEIDAITRVSERVRYTLPGCVHLNADVIPLEVLEGVDHVRVSPPDEAAVQPAVEPAPPPSADRSAQAEEGPAPAAEDASSGSGGSMVIFVAAALIGLLLLLAVMLRSGGRWPAPAAPPVGAPSPAGSPHAPSGAVLASQGGAGPRSVVPADPAPHDARTRGGPPEAEEEVGEENTDAILPTGTYGLRGAGGGERTEHIPLRPEDADEERETPWPGTIGAGAPERPVSMPSHAVISYSNPVRPRSVPSAAPAAPAPAEGDDEDFVRIGPVEAALATLGISTWLDFTAPGVAGVAFLPSTIAELIQVQNGGRLGYGWLLLLGLRRKNMDIMTLNGDTRVKVRFGEGWLVGVFAFGNVLWVGPDQAWEIRTLDGERIHLGAGPAEALRALAQSAELRDRGAPAAYVESCRTAVGELLPGWIYVQVPEPSVLPDSPEGHSSWEPVQILPFLELLSRR